MSCNYCQPLWFSAVEGNVVGPKLFEDLLRKCQFFYEPHNLAMIYFGIPVHNKRKIIELNFLPSWSCVSRYFKRVKITCVYMCNQCLNFQRQLLLQIFLPEGQIKRLNMPVAVISILELKYNISSYCWFTKRYRNNFHLHETLLLFGAYVWKKLIWCYSSKFQYFLYLMIIDHWRLS